MRTLRREHGARIAADVGGREWCGADTKPKRRYATIDEAWRASLIMFVQTGRVLHPYRCARRLKVRSGLIVTPHPNPWSWRGWLSRRVDRSTKKDACDGWHLTRQSWHLLPTNDVP